LTTVNIAKRIVAEATEAARLVQPSLSTTARRVFADAQQRGRKLFKTCRRDFHGQRHIVSGCDMQDRGTSVRDGVTFEPKHP
jgi:hypothetical protein